MVDSVAHRLLLDSYLLGLLFDPEDGVSMFLRNVIEPPPDYAMIYPRRVLFVFILKFAQQKHIYSWMSGGSRSIILLGITAVRMET
jgi:hypothetical protein